MGQYDDECRQEQTNDVAWMLARFCYWDTTILLGDDSAIPGHGQMNSVATQDEDAEAELASQEVKQPVAVWSAYNSMAQPKDAPSVIDNAFGLLIIHQCASP